MRLLLVEDDAILAEQLRSLLDRAGFAVDLASDGETALLMVAGESYDAAVLDLGLPSIPGLEVLRAWRKQGNALPVLILTSRGNWAERVEGLNSGADDYVSKPFQPDELVARLRALIRRASGRAQPMLELGELTVDPVAGKAFLGGEPVELTATELRLLVYLLHKRGQIVSQVQLAEHVYPLHETRDSNTMEVYVARLRKKLGREIIQTVRGLGYRMG